MTEQEKQSLCQDAIMAAVILEYKLSIAVEALDKIHKDKHSTREELMCLAFNAHGAITYGEQSLPKPPSELQEGK